MYNYGTIVNAGLRFTIDNIKELLPEDRVDMLRKHLRRVGSIPYFNPTKRLEEAPNLRVIHSNTYSDALRLARNEMKNYRELPEVRDIVTKYVEAIRQKGPKSTLNVALGVACAATSRIMRGAIYVAARTELQGMVINDGIEMARAIVLWGHDLKNINIRVRENALMIWEAGYGSAGFVHDGKRIVHYAFAADFVDGKQQAPPESS